MIVQIYDVTTPAETRALGAMGVDHIHALVGDGSFQPRRWPKITSKWSRIRTAKRLSFHQRTLMCLSCIWSHSS